MPSRGSIRARTRKSGHVIPAVPLGVYRFVVTASEVSTSEISVTLPIRRAYPGALPRWATGKHEMRQMARFVSPNIPSPADSETVPPAESFAERVKFST
jgi:hypothetical protein